MVIPTCSESFSIIIWRYFVFFKMANICFLKTEKFASTPLTLWLWRLTLPPGKVVPPFFFHENDCKGCRRDYLNALGNFLWRFRATGVKPNVQQPPLVRRGLNWQSWQQKKVCLFVGHFFFFFFFFFVYVCFVCLFFFDCLFLFVCFLFFSFIPPFFFLFSLKGALERCGIYHFSFFSIL